jgi:hypothetical protein
MTDRQQTALMVIASWDETNINSLTTSELRKIIKNMATVAREALEDEKAPEPFPWERI